MTTKIYCDKCGEEIEKEYVKARFVNNFNPDFTVGNIDHNDVDICTDCIQKLNKDFNHKIIKND